MPRNPIPPSVYQFLYFIRRSKLEKKVLDCGAGGRNPPLQIFYLHGYECHGIDITKAQIHLAREFCNREKMDLKIIEGDMRKLPYANESFSYVYTWNTIFHLPRKEMIIAIEEIFRVLCKDGIVYFNLLSTDDYGYGKGTEHEKGEFSGGNYHGKELHTYLEDSEAGELFANYKVLLKQKRTAQRWLNNRYFPEAWLDYIVQKID